MSLHNPAQHLAVDRIECRGKVDEAGDEGLLT